MMRAHKHWHGNIDDDDDELEDEEDDDVEDEEEGYVEQLCDVVCPHCHRPIQIVVAPAEDSETGDLEEEEDDEEDDEEDEI